MKVIVNENPSDISNFGQVARLSHHKQGGGEMLSGRHIQMTCKNLWKQDSRGKYFTITTKTRDAKSIRRRRKKKDRSRVDLKKLAFDKKIKIESSARIAPSDDVKLI